MWNLAVGRSWERETSQTVRVSKTSERRNTSQNDQARQVSKTNLTSYGKNRAIADCLSNTAQIFFDNVRVPKRNRIGDEGQGFTYQMVQFQEERLWGAAACLKAHEFIIAETIEYTRNRKAFGGRSSITRPCTSSSRKCRPRSSCCAR